MDQSLHHTPGSLKNEGSIRDPSDHLETLEVNRRLYQSIMFIWIAYFSNKPIQSALHHKNKKSKKQHPVNN